MSLALVIMGSSLLVTAIWWFRKNSLALAGIGITGLLLLAVGGGQIWLSRRAPSGYVLEPVDYTSQSQEQYRTFDTTPPNPPTLSKAEMREYTDKLKTFMHEYNGISEDTTSAWNSHVKEVKVGMNPWGGPEAAIVTDFKADNDTTHEIADVILHQDEVPTESVAFFDSEGKLLVRLGWEDGVLIHYED